MLIGWLAAVASAADVTGYPFVADVSLPARGVSRIDVPADLRSVDEDGRGTELLLVDGEGRIVPLVALTGEVGREEVRASRHGDVGWTPTAEPGVWRLTVRDEPLDALSLDLPPSDVAAFVTLRTEAGAPVGEPVLVWHNGGDVVDTVPVPRQLGTFLVEVKTTDDRVLSLGDVRGIRWDAPEPPRLAVEVPVVDVQLEESGWVRYSLALERPLPLRGVRVDPAEDVFQRQAQLEEVRDLPDGVVDPMNIPWNPTAIRRLRMGETRAERTWIPSGARSARLALRIDAQGVAPLTLDTVSVEMGGLQLLVKDPGPGPHRLYGGGLPVAQNEAEAFPADRAVALPELYRAVDHVAEVGDAAPNPVWLPPEEATGLSEPGAMVDVEAFDWRRPVQGEGLVRIPLDASVLAAAHTDLGDIRLVDGDGRQIPYLLVRGPGDLTWAGVDHEVRERDGRVLLVVPVPEPGVRLSSLTLSTSALVFDRTVTVERPRGRALTPVRAVRWNGQERPGRLTIALDQTFDDTLVVGIDNGDDAALPIHDLTLRAPSWELVASLPDEPVWMIYGGTATAPSYDIWLLQESLRRRATTLATLGPAESIAPEGPSATQRMLALAGVGVLALTLLGLAASLILSRPAGEG